MATTTGRREWLSMLVRGAAAATVGVLGQPRAARSDDGCGHPCIKHIVVLMMENRSFDHMLGLLMNEIPDLRGVRGGDWTNVDDKGNVHTLRAGAAYQGQFLVDPPHDFWSVHQQLYAHPGQPATRPPQPDMLGFAATYARAGGDPTHIMKCFSPERLPTIRALAKNYLVCDNWFASVPGPTNPNRAFAHFGTSFGRVDNGPVWFMMLNRRLEQGIHGRLRDRGKTAKIYYYSPQSGTMAADHHPDSFVLAGDQFIRNVYEAIRSSDELWRSTLFLIVWDEHGGIFDHVSPPTLPYGDSFRSPVAGFSFDRQRRRRYVVEDPAV